MQTGVPKKSVLSVLGVLAALAVVVALVRMGRSGEVTDVHLHTVRLGDLIESITAPAEI